MSATEMYDFLPGTASADYDYTLTLSFQDVIVEQGEFPGQKVHPTDGTNRPVTTRNTTPRFYLSCILNNATESDVGTLVDLYYNTSKAKGMARSFRLDHTTDGHTYIVKFNMKSMSRKIKELSVHGITTIDFIVIDRVDDA